MSRYASIDELKAIAATQWNIDDYDFCRSMEVSEVCLICIQCSHL
jgi:hypothetical protein